MDRCVPIQKCLPLSFASGIYPSKLDVAINLGDVFPFNIPILSYVYVLVHYAKHHMDTCVQVCWALGACIFTLYVYFASGTPFLYRLFRVQLSTGVCICPCALRHTPHGHMCIGVFGSVCVCMYSVLVLRLRNPFPLSCILCSGVHCRATRLQHTCVFLI